MGFRTHPDLVSDYRVAKRAAAAIASHIGATLLQLADGKTKRIILGGRVIDCASWFAAWSTLQRIRADQIGVR